MGNRLVKKVSFPEGDGDLMFQLAADLFRVLSAPMRLRIIRCLCDGERNVTELLSEIETTQPNMSQHLSTLFTAGILSKRRDGVQIYYCIADQRVSQLCKVVCVQVAADSGLATA
jgi:DNA-binding transcriptional ArsR family regulator